MNLLPLGTVIVAGAFTYSLAKQYLERRKMHQLLWTGAMLFFAVAALMEFLMNGDLFGPNVLAFKVYYILAAPLVGLLGAGVVYLLASKRVSDIFLVLLGIASLLLLVTTATATIDEATLIDAFQGPLGEAFHKAIQAISMDVRRYAIIINIIGGTVLLAGSVWSYIRDRRRTYNALLFLGGLLPGIGGSLMGLFNQPNLFFLFELLGTIFLYGGFILSDRFIKENEARIAEALSKK